MRYVRQRYALLRGDFDRIQRQQNVLRAMLDQVASAGTLANPVRITHLVTELATFVVAQPGELKLGAAHRSSSLSR